MSRRQAEYAIKQMLISGYGHYSRADEDKILTAFLQGADLQLSENTMTDFPLAAQPLRSIKNSLICSVAIMCRYAADLGADDERCYAMSDYYINEIENKMDVNNWRDMYIEISHHYIELVRIGRSERYSLPIKRAIRYIQHHLYEACRLQEVAASVKLNPSYLSALFKQEMGVPLTNYVRGKKISEAKSMLQEGKYSISEIAEMLGYNSLSYFSKAFRQVTSFSPREFKSGISLSNVKSINKE